MLVQESQVRRLNRLALESISGDYMINDMGPDVTIEEVVDSLVSVGRKIASEDSSEHSWQAGTTLMWEAMMNEIDVNTLPLI